MCPAFLPTLPSWAPTRVQPRVVWAKRTKPSFVQKQRKVFFVDQRMERWELRSRAQALPDRPWAGLLYRGLPAGRGRGRGSHGSGPAAQLPALAADLGCRGARRLCTRPAAASLGGGVLHGDSAQTPERRCWLSCLVLGTLVWRAGG